jgi:hypothetical protein
MNSQNKRGIFVRLLSMAINSFNKKPSIICLLLICFFNNISNSFAQVEDYKVRAGWIIALIQYTKWNKANIDNPTICTIGHDSVGVFLRQIQKEKSLPVLIEEKNRDADIKDCQILYVSESEKDQVSSIIDNINGHPVLTISTVKRFAEMGGVVEFVIKEDKVSLLINISSVKKAHLIIDSDLLSVSEHIE